MNFFALVCLLLFSSLLAGAASGVTDSYLLRDGLAGYGGTADTMIMPIPANNNYGAYPSLLVGKMGENERRSLLRFDLERLKGQKAQSARLTLSQVNVRQFREGRFTIGLFPINAGNADWQEGRGKGEPALAGEPVWRARGHADTPWAGSAGLSTAGVDFAPLPAATIVYDAGNDTQSVTVELPADLIQQWIDQPATNGGLLLKIIDEGQGVGMGAFRSSNYSNAAQRPQLEVFVD